MKRARSTARLKDSDATDNTLWSFLAQVRKHIFPILSIGFGIAAIAMILGATIGSGGRIVGEDMVLTEVPILPGFSMKPITFFTFALFLSFAFGLYAPLTRRMFAAAPSSVLRIVFICAWLVAMGSGFEILYHIVLWSAALAVQGSANPDLITNPFPLSVNPTPINVVFASKMVVTIFFMSVFLIDYVHRIDRIKQERAMTARLSLR
jgi:hypothetical protein